MTQQYHVTCRVKHDATIEYLNKHTEYIRQFRSAQKKLLLTPKAGKRNHVYGLRGLNAPPRGHLPLSSAEEVNR